MAETGGALTVGLAVRPDGRWGFSVAVETPMAGEPADGEARHGSAHIVIGNAGSIPFFVWNNFLAGSVATVYLNGGSRVSIVDAWNVEIVHRIDGFTIASMSVPRDVFLPKLTAALEQAVADGLEMVDDPWYADIAGTAADLGLEDDE
jgi:hypothetical protein